MYITTSTLCDYRVKKINVLLLRQTFQVYFQGVGHHRERTGLSPIVPAKSRAFDSVYSSLTTSRGS